MAPHDFTGLRGAAAANLERRSVLVSGCCHASIALLMHSSGCFTWNFGEPHHGYSGLHLDHSRRPTYLSTLAKCKGVITAFTFSKVAKAACSVSARPTLSTCLMVRPDQSPWCGCIGLVDNRARPACWLYFCVSGRNRIDFNRQNRLHFSGTLLMLY